MLFRSRKNKNEQNRKLWKVAVYIRLSRDDGNDESLSVLNQRKIIQDYLENSFDGEYEIVDYYIDDGQSGTTDYERVAFQRMIQDVEAGVINCVICKTLARAFRNYSDHGYFLERIFPLYGVRFISLGDPSIDTFLNPEVTHGMEVPISGIMNDRYAARTSNDIRRTFDLKRRKGEFISAFAPYGYKKNPENKNHLIIDEEAAKVVRDIFHWFVYEGMSKLGIVKRLNALGVLSPTRYKLSKGSKFKAPQLSKSDGLWSINTIYTILKNKIYIGTMVQGKERIISYKVHDRIRIPEEEWYIVENTHEPIIDKDTFEKAQILGRRDTRTAPAEKRVYLFSGFLRCSDCGRSMNRKSSRKKTKSGVKEYVYYVCSTYALKSKERCTIHSIKMEDLEKAVLQTIQVQIALVEDMASIIKEINIDPVVEIHSKQLEISKQAKQQELEKRINVIDNLYLDWKSGDITKEEYFRMKAKFEHQVEDLKQTIQNIEIEISTKQQNNGVTDSYLKRFCKHKNIQSLDRGLLLDLVDKIYIHENKKITIQFNFADQHKRILEFIKERQEQQTAVQS